MGRHSGVKIPRINHSQSISPLIFKVGYAPQVSYSRIWSILRRPYTNRHKGVDEYRTRHTILITAGHPSRLISRCRASRSCSVPVYLICPWGSLRLRPRGLERTLPSFFLFAILVPSFCHFRFKRVVYETEFSLFRAVLCARYCFVEQVIGG